MRYRLRRAFAGDKETGQENVMPNSQSTGIPTEEQIRDRSYLLWEREGCQHGKSEEYWQRAKAELEAEMEAEQQAASMGGETIDFHLPVLPISTPPSKSVADKLPEDDEDLKKAVG